jgi:hypothetical protein
LTYVISAVVIYVAAFGGVRLVTGDGKLSPNQRLGFKKFITLNVSKMLKIRELESESCGFLTYIPLENCQRL